MTENHEQYFISDAINSDWKQRILAIGPSLLIYAKSGLELRTKQRQSVKTSMELCVKGSWGLQGLTGGGHGTTQKAFPCEQRTGIPR